MNSQTSVLCFNVKQLSSIVSSAFQVSRFVCAQKTVALCRQVSPRGRTFFFNLLSAIDLAGACIPEYEI